MCDLLIVDDIDNFIQTLGTNIEFTLQNISGEKEGSVSSNFTCGPFKNTPIKSDPGIGKNMVAMYKRHFDGYGLVKKWDYTQKKT
jgi:hypothetical protein